jgi:hypothetical protein
MLVEEVHQLGEVGQRSGQPVDLVDDNDVDLPAADIIEQFLKGWAVEEAPDRPPRLIRRTPRAIGRACRCWTRII